MYPRYEMLFFAAKAEVEPLIFHVKSLTQRIQQLEAEVIELRNQP